MNRKTIVFLMFVAVLFSGCEGTSQSVGSDVIVPGVDLANKLDWIQSNARNSDNYIIEINANESIDPQNLFNDRRNNITITLRSTGSTYTINLASIGSLFTINPGVTLILDNITLNGRNDNNAALILVNGGSLIMKSGTITGNSGIIHGGGVYVDGPTSSFIMEGGTISGNTARDEGNATMHLPYRESGGGVNLHSGSFIMRGGTISGNTANSGGGVRVYDSTSNFIMEGGTISGNTARDGGDGGGVNLFAGSFVMRGGTISGNNALTRQDGTGLPGVGGGVFLSHDASFTMEGGTISGNRADGSGGGVSVGSYRLTAIFTMKGGTISGNTARDGGGVFLNNQSDVSFIKTGGTIHGSNEGSNSNIATWANGESSAVLMAPTIVRMRTSTAGPTMNTDNPDFWEFNL